MTALNQLGSDVTSDPEIVRALFLRFGLSTASPPSTATVVEIVGSLARSALEGKALCDVAALTRALGFYVSTSVSNARFVSKSLHSVPLCIGLLSSKLSMTPIVWESIQRPSS